MVFDEWFKYKSRIKHLNTNTQWIAFSCDSEAWNKEKVETRMRQNFLLLYRDCQTKETQILHQVMWWQWHLYDFDNRAPLTAAAVHDVSKVYCHLSL